MYMLKYKIQKNIKIVQDAGHKKVKVDLIEGKRDKNLNLVSEL